MLLSTRVHDVLNALNPHTPCLTDQLGGRRARPHKVSMGTIFLLLVLLVLSSVAPILLSRHVPARIAPRRPKLAFRDRLAAAPSRLVVREALDRIRSEIGDSGPEN